MTKDDNSRLIELFFGYAQRKERALINTGSRFAYYTNAETALKIINNSEIWLRNANLMNDYSEIRHGHSCLLYAMNRGGRELLRGVFETSFPGLLDNILSTLDRQIPTYFDKTYLSCFSKVRKNKIEDGLGRLSMWRAYGGTTGVALIFGHGTLLKDSSPFNLYTSPVAYLTHEQTLNQLEKLCSSLLQEIDFIKSRPKEDIEQYLGNALRFAILSIKHPGFMEEREWRVIYQPELNKSDLVKEEIETVRGIPQLVQKVNFGNLQDIDANSNNTGILLDKIIVGPTLYPQTISDSLVEALRRKGLTNANEIVCKSNIPLRHWN